MNLFLNPRGFLSLLNRNIEVLFHPHPLSSVLVSSKVRSQKWEGNEEKDIYFKPHPFSKPFYKLFLQ